MTWHRGYASTPQSHSSLTVGTLASHQPQAFRCLWPPFSSITLMILLSWRLSWINLGSSQGPEIIEEPGCSYSHSCYLYEQKHWCFNTVNVVPPPLRPLQPDTWELFWGFQLYTHQSWLLHTHRHSGANPTLMDASIRHIALFLCKERLRFFPSFMLV